jgi:HEAT repeat protein
MGRKLIEMRRYFFAVLSLKLPCLFLVVVFLLTGCTFNLDLKGGKISTQDLDKLIRQLEQGELYWDTSGKAMSPFTLSMIDKIDYQEDAAKILGKLAKKGYNVEIAVPALIRSLKPNKFENQGDYGIIPLRAKSAQALGFIKDSRAIDGLLELLKDSKQCLSTKPASHCEPIMAGFEYIEAGLLGRQKAAESALGEIGVKRPDVVNYLVSGLNDKSPYFLEDCANALAKLKVEEAIDILINRIKNDPDKNIQSVAVKSLSAFGAKANKSVPILVSRIQRSVDPSIGEIETLIKIGTPDARNALKEFARSNNPKLRDAVKRTQDMFELELEVNQNRIDLGLAD